MNYLTGLAHKAREFVTEVGDVGFWACSPCLLRALGVFAGGLHCHEGSFYWV